MKNRKRPRPKPDRRPRPKPDRKRESSFSLKKSNEAAPALLEEIVLAFDYDRHTSDGTSTGMGVEVVYGFRNGEGFAGIKFSERFMTSMNEARTWLKQRFDTIDGSLGEK